MSQIAITLHKATEERDFALGSVLRTEVTDELFQRIDLVMYIRDYAQSIPFDADWCKNHLIVELDGTQGYLPPCWRELMYSRDPFHPGKRIYETHVLMHFIAGSSLHWVRHLTFKKGKKLWVHRDHIGDYNKYGSVPIKRHYWGIITTEPVPDSDYSRIEKISEANEAIKERGGWEEEMIEAYPYRTCSLAEVSQATALVYNSMKGFLNIEGTIVNDKIGGELIVLQTHPMTKRMELRRGEEFLCSYGSMAIRTFDELDNLEHILETLPDTAEKIIKITRRYYNYIETPEQYRETFRLEERIHSLQSYLPETKKIDWEEVD